MWDEAHFLSFTFLCQSLTVGVAMNRKRKGKTVQKKRKCFFPECEPPRLVGDPV